MEIFFITRFSLLYLVFYFKLINGENEEYVSNEIHNSKVMFDQSVEEIPKLSHLHKMNKFENGINNDQSPEEEVEKEHHDSTMQKSTIYSILNEEELQIFLNIKSIQIIYFYSSENDELSHQKISATFFKNFIEEYKIASHKLKKYGVALAMLNCFEYHVSGYCQADKVGRFAYGFKERQEKIAFPLDTFYTSHAIIASALHLSLINTVPIIQSATERRKLELRCNKKCDIIFAFQRTLGTFRHREFLEVAFDYQDKFMFALTTYKAGTTGLPTPPKISDAEEEDDEGMWVLHCMSQKPGDDCIISQYRGEFIQQQLRAFINILLINPTWENLEGCSKPERQLSTSPCKFNNDYKIPFTGTDLPYGMLIYGTEDATRAQDLAPQLALLFHGSIAIITVKNDIPDNILNTLGLSKDRLDPPQLAFLKPGETKALMVTDYDDALPWFTQLLESLQVIPKSTHEYQAADEIDELQQDDEVVLSMMKVESIGIPSLDGQQDFDNHRKKYNGILLTAMYLPWDPASNLLLQHLKSLELYNDSSIFITKINCFDYPGMCSSYKSYPTLLIYPDPGKNYSIIYDGSIEGGQIRRTILIIKSLMDMTGSTNTTNLTTEDEILRFLYLDESWKKMANLDVPVPCVYFNIQDNNGTTLLNYAHLHDGSYGRRHVILGMTNLTTTKPFCKNTRSSCIICNNTVDLFLKKRLIELSGNVTNKEINNFLDLSSISVFEKLTPDRHSIITQTSNSRNNINRYIAILFLPSDFDVPTLNTHEENSQPDVIEQNQANEFVDELCNKEKCVFNYLHKTNDGNRYCNQDKTCKYPKNTADIYNKDSTDKNNSYTNIFKVAIRKLWKFLGETAGQYIYSTISFSWLNSDNIIAMQLLERHDLSDKQPQLIVQDASGNNRERDGVGKGRVFILPSDQIYNHTFISIWIQNILQERQKPTTYLHDGKWTPRVAGFDYMKFMEDDREREEEARLVMEMEGEIAAHTNTT